MEWRQRFRKLITLRQEHYENVRRQETREIEEKRAEIQRINEVYLPKIEKLCKEFAKALGWKYYRRKCNIDLFGHGHEGSNEFFIKNKEGYIKLTIAVWINFWHTPSINVNYNYKEVPPYAVVIEGSKFFELSYDSGTYTPAAEFIPLNEFSEEKLANALERCFKALYKIE